MSSIDAYSEEAIRGSIMIYFFDGEVKLLGSGVPLWAYLELIDVLELKKLIADFSLRDQSYHGRNAVIYTVKASFNEGSQKTVSVHESYHILKDRARQDGSTLLITIRKDV